MQDGETGVLAPAGDDAAVAQALAALLRDTSRRRQMGAAGRKSVSPRFAVSTLLTTMEGFYTSLVVRQR